MIFGKDSTFDVKVRCWHDLRSILIEIEVAPRKNAEVVFPFVQGLQSLLHLSNFKGILHHSLLRLNLSLFNGLLEFLDLAQIKYPSDVHNLVEYGVREVESDVARVPFDMKLRFLRVLQLLLGCQHQ
jgi:hypothetical protein